MPASTPAKTTFASLDFQPLDWLLLAIPAACALWLVPAWHNETLLFFASGLAIIPLAGWMSRAVENLGERIGPGLSGFLNATFSNAPELIIAIMALSKGLVGVVKASIIGSILGNILVVLGFSMLAGGLRFRHLHYNQTGIRVAATSLTLATIGLIIPTIFQLSAKHDPGLRFPAAAENLSVAIAAVLLGTYVLWIIFSMMTHKELFAGEAAEKVNSAESDAPAWSLSKSVVVLAIATLLIAALSEFLAGSVETACRSLGLTEVFVGIVIVSIISNAGESTAVFVALKNKMDLSLSIAIGSSLQIALFVMPMLVFVSHFLGTPMTLEFTLPEVASLVLAVYLVVLISGDGECNWIEGAQLLSVYAIIAVLFYFLPDPSPGSARSTASPTPLSIPAK